MTARTRVAPSRGSAVVEFALVLPLLLMIALAVLQTGLLAKDLMIVQEAARAGARQASVSGDDTSVVQAVDEAASSLAPAGLSTTVRRGPAPGAPATVDVAYEAPVSLPLLGWLLPPTVRLSSDATMRQETGG